ncbi:hypothetical protein AX16_008783 [Volvariella volvacea WC 439]|nr:hypothetical protein AX16_008783 [Volvariella volvacea WC 439]
MSQNAEALASTQLSQQKVSGFRTALRYTGIPPSWLDKRPKLPSRNWLIFLSVTSSLTGLYIYDRRKCKEIRQDYIERVKDLAEVTSHPLDAPRKVMVYGAKWPGDEDHEQALKYFRKYIKPILVAAAVDYEMVSGKRHGDIARRVAEDIRLRRRADSGIDPISEVHQRLPTYKPLPEVRQRELEGGIIIVGRPTFKEFMAGLKRGWTEGLEKVDHEERLAQELQDDGRFDEPEIESDGSTPDASSTLPPVGVFSPLQIRPNPPPPRPPTSLYESVAADIPTKIPPVPPLLLVPFTNHIGFSQIPLMIWDFFHHRHKVRTGAEAAYLLIKSNTRPISHPNDTSSSPVPDQVAPTDDLRFDTVGESYFKKSLKDFPSDIEKTRKKYYEALPDKLKVARDLARGVREPSKEEYNHPPPTEVELRAERLKKEQRWRSDLEGWDIVRPSAPVTWDERFRDALRVFTNPVEQSEQSDSKQ